MPVEAGTPFINERGRMLYVDEGERTLLFEGRRTLLVEGGRTLFVDLRVGQCGGKEEQ